MINANVIDNEKIVEKLTEKKVDNYYNGSSDNFALNGEIVVTITLSEYRTLIKEVATKNTIQITQTKINTRENAETRHLKAKTQN